MSDLLMTKTLKAWRFLYRRGAGPCDGSTPRGADARAWRDGYRCERRGSGGQRISFRKKRAPGMYLLRARQTDMDR